MAIGKKPDRKVKLKTMFILFNTVLFIVFSSIVGLGTVFLTRNMIQENSRNVARGHFNNTRHGLNSYFAEIQLVASSMSRNTDILEYFQAGRDEPLSEAGEDTWQIRLSEVVNNSLLYEKGIHSIGIFSNTKPDGQYFGLINDRSIYQTPELSPQNEIFADRNLEIIWLRPFPLDFSSYKLMSLQRKVYDFSTFTEIGTIVVNVNMQHINKVLTLLEDRTIGFSLVMDEDRQIIARSEQAAYTGLTENGINLERTDLNACLFREIGNTDYAIIQDHIVNQDWYLVSLLPLESIQKDMRQAQLYVLILSIIAVAITMSISIFYSSRLSKVFMSLLDQLHIIERRSVIFNFPRQSFYEAQVLSDGLEKIFNEINSLIFEVYEKELRENEAHMQALQAQINPHFINNTLATINSLLVIDGNQVASEMINHLSDLMSYIMDNERSQTTLDKEFELMRKYLSIYKVRYGDRFAYELKLDGEVKDCQILKMLLQPLVENAILHGIDKRRRKGLLSISANRAGENIIIEITDNGAGMDQQTIDKLLLSPGPIQNLHQSRHIGVNNVHNRLRLHYGRHYGLEISSAIDKGTRIIVKIPYCKFSEDEEEEREDGRS